VLQIQVEVPAMYGIALISTRLNLVTLISIQ